MVVSTKKLAMAVGVVSIISGVLFIMCHSGRRQRAHVVEETQFPTDLLLNERIT